MTPSPSRAADGADDCTELERLWLVFVEASTRAQRTLIFADGMAAREAWAAFMTAYDPPRGLAPSGRS